MGSYSQRWRLEEQGFMAFILSLFVSYSFFLSTIACQAFLLFSQVSPPFLVFQVGLRRIDAAYDALSPMGFSNDVVRKTIRSLLKVNSVAPVHVTHI